MKIVLMVLHIVCAVVFGVCAIMNTNMVGAILNMVASVLWSICAGMDVAQMISKN